MSALRRKDRGRFEVDFAARGWLGALWPWSKTGAVDPHGIAQAVIGAMRACELRSAHGAPLVWNEYRMFLSREDFDSLRAVLRRTQAGLDTLIRQELERLGAETVGEPVVRLCFDEAQDIPVNHGVLEVGFAEGPERPDGEGQVTIRLGRAVAPPAIAAAPPPPQGDSTIRLGAAGGGLRLRWGEHEVLIPSGAVKRLGRPHPEAPPDFVPLHGAGNTISRVHLLVDNSGAEPLLMRPSEANPVHVGSTLLAPGARFVPPALPVRVVLANDQLVIVLERA